MENNDEVLKKLRSLGELFLAFILTGFILIMIGVVGFRLTTQKIRELGTVGQMKLGEPIKQELK